MGTTGAVGSTNLTPSRRRLLRRWCTASAQPAPVSPRPWAKTTVAVCLPTAGTTTGATRCIVEAMAIADEGAVAALPSGEAGRGEEALGEER